MSTLLADVRHGWRRLARSPGVALAVVAMLALGIGVDATVFCWVRTIVLDPLPGASGRGRLVNVVPVYRGDVRFATLSYPDFVELRGMRDVFSGVLGSSSGAALLSVAGRSEWIYGRVATADTFDVLGVRPERGRLFLPGEDRGEGAHPVVVISDALWRRRFGADPAVVGRAVRLNRTLFTIVGVAPRELRGLHAGWPIDFWAPLSMHREILDFGSYDSRTFRWVEPLARLRPGVSAARAQAAVATLARRLAATFPASNRDLGLAVYPLWRSPIGGQAELLPVLSILAAVAAGVLLIVMVNVANLLLAEAASREREIAVRQALGAGRWRLLRQMVAESLVVAASGGLAAALLAAWAVRLFSLFIAATNLPFSYDFALDRPTVALIALLSLAAAVVCGLTAALSGGGSVGESLKEGGRRAGSGLRHRRLRGGLVVAEVALALALLIGAGLAIEGFQKASRIELGFAPDHLLVAELSLVPNGYSVAAGRLFDRRLRQWLEALPGVADVALASVLPLGLRTVFTAAAEVEGQESRPGEDRSTSFLIVSPGFLRALRIPLLAGRDLSDRDGPDAPRTVVVDEVAARRFFPGRDPLGRRLRLTVGVGAPESFTVVGVARSIKVRSLAEPPTPLVYVQYEQRPLAALFMSAVVRTRGDPAAAAGAVAGAIHALDPGVEPFGVEPVAEYIAPAFAQARIAATLLGVLGGAALALACLGLYGVMAYLVARRAHEIGVRMALGAGRGHVLRLIAGEGMAMVALGAAAGLALALGATRLLASVLYGVSPTDALVFLAAPALLALVGLAACYLPARRATRVDPVVALNDE